MTTGYVSFGKMPDGMGTSTPKDVGFNGGKTVTKGTPDLEAARYQNPPRGAHMVPGFATKGTSAPANTGPAYNERGGMG